MVVHLAVWNCGEKGFLMMGHYINDVICAELVSFTGGACRAFETVWEATHHHICTSLPLHMTVNIVL